MFDYINNKVEISKEALTIPQIKTLYDLPSGKLLLTCLYHLYNPNSPYAKQSFEQRTKSITAHFKLKDDWEKLPVVIDAAKVYEATLYTAKVKMLESAKNVLHKTANYFDNVDYSAKDTDGKPVYKVTEVVNALSKIDKILETITKLEDEVAKEQAMSGERVRGGATFSSVFTDL